MGCVNAKPDVRQKPIQLVARYRLPSFVLAKGRAAAIVRQPFIARAKPSECIHPIRLRTPHHRIVQRCCLTSPFVAHEKIILPADRRRLAQPLRGLVVHRQISLLELTTQSFPLNHRVDEGCPHRTLWKNTIRSLLGIKPLFKSVADRTGMVLPRLCDRGKVSFALQVLCRIGLAKLVLDFK